MRQHWQCVVIGVTRLLVVSQRRFYPGLPNLNQEELNQWADLNHDYYISDFNEDLNQFF